MTAVQHASAATFDKLVLQSPVPVLVDFFANWCGPCRAIAPALEKLAAEYSGRARIVKVDIDANPELADRFEVQSIPTLVFATGGKLVGKVAGLVPEGTLRQALDRLIAANANAQRRAG